MPTPSNSMNQNSTTAGLATWDGASTPSTTAITQYNVLSGATSTTVNNIAPSTSGYVLTSNGGSAQPTFQAIPYTALTWTDKSSSFSAAAGNGYFVTATATATLPVPVANGATCSFAVDVTPGTGKLTITAGTGGYIRVGNQITATPATGGITNNAQGDSITLVYRASDLTWIAIDGPQGTWSMT